MNIDRITDFILLDCQPPESALDMAATLLMDTLGVVVGAAGMEAGRIARDHAYSFHGAARDEWAATILFDGRRASIPGAAFAAATQIDNLDAHDGLNATKGHIGCAVVPALFAFAETRPELSARDALVAMVMAYEVAARAACALHATVADYHTSGAWNALGVAALGCRLIAATSDQTRHALGIAEYHGPRSQMMREIANPTMLHDGSGMGALVGTMAALMSTKGFAGAPAITLEDEKVRHFWDDLGKVWTVEQNYIKPYPICRWAHAALDAMSQLMRDHGFTSDQIERVTVNTFAESAALFPGMPKTTSQAQYSLAFAVASLAVHGQVGPEQISGGGLRDPKVARLLPRIAVCEDARHSQRFPEGRWSDVTVMLKDGQRLESGDVNARGGPEAPLPLEEVEQKFRLMTAALSEARASELWAWREKLLDSNAQFSDLAQLTHAKVEDALA